jgi:hypothetical protein
MAPIKKIFLSLLFASLLSQGIYFLFARGIKKYDVHKSDRLNEILLNNTNYDLVFLGSSRIHSDIYPKIIDSITGLNSYNLGVEGGNLFEFKLTLDAYLEKHPAPKLLVLGIDYKSFDLGRKFYNYCQYFPFVKNTVIKNALINEGHYSGAFDFIKFLQLTEIDDYTKINSVKGMLGLSEIPKGDFQYKGYMSNTDACIVSDNVIYDTSRNTIDSNAIKMLQDIVTTCKQKGIKIIFVSLPNYKQLYKKTAFNFNESLAIEDSFARKTGGPLLRHDLYGINDSAKYFANMGHLNRPGSYVYSVILGNEIRGLLLGH